jgi:hypothetical protein
MFRRSSESSVLVIFLFLLVVFIVANAMPVFPLAVFWAFYAVAVFIDHAFTVLAFVVFVKMFSFVVASAILVFVIKVGTIFVFVVAGITIFSFFLATAFTQLSFRVEFFGCLAVQTIAIM